VGGGNDVSAEVSGHISEAVGSFDSVAGVTSESDSAQGANAYTLQLNTNDFTTSTCSGAANPSQCQGWQQFIYSNYPNNSTYGGAAGTQYWLLYYGTTNCPTGWTSYQDYGIDYCWTNGNAVGVPAPAQTIANLGNLSLTGEAVSGGMDTLIFSTGSALYSVQNEDSVVHLAQGWTAAEFNIFGACCNSQANFNSGSTIVVRTSVDYGSPNAPSCLAKGFTGETNNLSFGTAPAAHAEKLPAAVFTESSAGGVASPCESETSVGSAPSKLTLAATASATTQVGKAYSQTNVASGGATPYAYSVSSGALPAGTNLNASTGTVSGTPTTAGAFSYAIKVTDSGRPAQTATATSSGTIAPAATTTAIKSSVNPSTFGESATFTATVASSGGTPTGTVTFKDGTTTLGGGALASGVASFTTSALSAGSHSITAAYDGAADFAPSTSPALRQTVNTATTTTAIKSSVNPSAYGQAVTFTATVASSGGTPTGTVTFKDGTTTLGSGALASGVASFTTSALSVGSHSITAAYDGATDFAPSTSPALRQTVNTATTATAIKSSVNPSAYGQAVTFTATVTSSGGAPTGTVTFKDGTTTLGSGALASGVASFTTSALSAGAHTITAAYGGDANFVASASSALTQTVNLPVYQGFAFVTAVNGGATNACILNGINVGDYYTMLYRSAAETDNAAYGGGIGFASERSSVALDLAAGKSLLAGQQVQTVTAVGQSSLVGPFTTSSTFNLDIAPNPLLATTPGVTISGTVTNMWGFDGCIIALRASLTLRPQ
jgi:hypothetical protein